MRSDFVTENIKRSSVETGVDLVVSVFVFFSDVKGLDLFVHQIAFSVITVIPSGLGNDL